MENFAGTDDNCDVSLMYDDIENVFDKIHSAAIFSVITDGPNSQSSITYIRSDLTSETLSINEAMNGYFLEYEKSIHVEINESNTAENTTIYDIATANYILSQCTEDEICPCTNNGYFLPSRLEIIHGRTDNKLFLFYYYIIQAYRMGIDIGENEKYLDLDVVYEIAKGKVFQSMEEFQGFFHFLFTDEVDEIRDKLTAKLQTM